MLILSLTSIPPRFGQLLQVLATALAQPADKVIVNLPQSYRRFVPAPLPALPAGVEVIETESDLGPAGKLLAAARAYPEADILYCDDDWLYGSGWVAAFLAARARASGPAVFAASSWPTERIGRRGGTIAQGFAGVLVPAGVGACIPDPPPEAWAVDDIWLSGHFTGFDLPVLPVPGARALCRPLPSPGALQADAERNAANRRVAALIASRFGIWPEASPQLSAP